MQAVFEDTAPANHAPWVLPGGYLARLTVNGVAYDQPLVVKMDPRVKTSAEGLAEQFTLSKRLYDGLEQGSQAMEESQALRAKFSAKSDEGSKAVSQKLEDFEGHRGARFGGGGRLPIEGPATLSKLTTSLETLIVGLQEADVAPTANQKSAVMAQLREMDQLLERWKKLKQEISK
jgi:hypothetical protein